MGNTKGARKGDTSERYLQAWKNTMLGLPTQQGIEKKLRSKPILEAEVKPTFEITKVNDYIHNTKYKENVLYKYARERNDKYYGINVLKFWYKWIETLASQKNISIWGVAEEAGMPKVLQLMAEKSYKNLCNISLAYRFANMLNEPFIPVYSQEELQDYVIPIDLYEKVVKFKRKNSLDPYKYGKRKLSKAAKRYLDYQKNIRYQKLKWEN